MPSNFEEKRSVKMNQSKDISRKVVIILLIITIFTSILGTLLVLSTISPVDASQPFISTAKVAVTILPQ